MFLYEEAKRKNLVPDGRVMVDLIMQAYQKFAYSYISRQLWTRFFFTWIDIVDPISSA